MKSLDFKLMNLKKAYGRLTEACERWDGRDDFIRDSVIQRFELTYELCHKTMREFMGYMGIEQNSAFPRTVFRTAYANGIIEDEKTWLAMIDDRNHTSHIYSESMTNAAAERIRKKYVPAIGELIANIEKNM